MQDPLQENITGEKRHSFEHRIDWGYVALALAVLAVVWFLAFRLELGNSSSEESEQRDFENATEVALTG